MVMMEDKPRARNGLSARAQRPGRRCRASDGQMRKESGFCITLAHCSLFAFCDWLPARHPHLSAVTVTAIGKWSFTTTTNTIRGTTFSRLRRTNDGLTTRRRTKKRFSPAFKLEVVDNMEAMEVMEAREGLCERTDWLSSIESINPGYKSSVCK